jgi:hypothetical protein
MSTKPHHTYEAIARDAVRVHAVAVEDLHEREFARHCDRHELEAYRANIAKLETGSAARTHYLDAQLAAGVHVAQSCAALAELCRAVRDAAELEFFADAKHRDEPLARAFGMGHPLDATSLTSVEVFAHALLAAAAAHPRDAAKAHLDRDGLHHLHDLLAAVEGTDIAHGRARAARHDASTALDSLAHLVAAETAHIRFVAKRVFRGNEAKLARYASTLPRHTVAHRTRHAPDPAPTDGA